MGLDLVDLAFRVEQEFGITIDNDEAGMIVTVGQLYRYVLKKLDREDDAKEIWERLRTVVSEQAGVAKDQLTEETNFVDDLGLD